MSLPNFLGVGAQKAGTTTLYKVLKQHPDIYLPDQKELHFFDEHYQKGVDWYEKNFFSTHSGEKAVGEITPSYLFIEEAPERIFNTLGKHVKLIFLFRNPVDRAYSHYLMNRMNGLENLSFEDAIRLEGERLPENNTSVLRQVSYLHRGLYSRQVQRFLDFFPKENMLFLSFEEFIKGDQEKVYAKIFDFLEIPFHHLNYNIRSNQAGISRNKFVQRLLNTPNPASWLVKKILPNEQTRKRLRKKIKQANKKPYKYEKLSGKLAMELMHDYYIQDLKVLEGLTELNFSHWYNQKADFKSQKQ